MANGRMRMFFVAAVALVLLLSGLAYAVEETSVSGPVLVFAIGLAIITAVAITVSVVTRRRRLRALLHGSPEPDREFVCSSEA